MVSRSKLAARESAMRILCSYGGMESAFAIQQPQVVIGRASCSEAVDLDLAPDLKVSRRHARIWTEGGKYWIEDLNSSWGTQVNGIGIRGKGRWSLGPGDSVLIGDTTLRLEILEPEASPQDPGGLKPGATLAGGFPTDEPGIEIAKALDANERAFGPAAGATAETARRLELLYDLPLQFAAETRLDTLLQTIVERLVEIIPDADRGALLLRDLNSDALLLKAYRAAGGPSVSETLARRAMNEGKGFIWQRSIEGDISGSIVQKQIETGMYVPLLWQGQALGAICVDNRSFAAGFTEEALRLMLGVAQYAAMAVAGHQLQEKLQREAAARANLMRQFSPKVAERLLGHQGPLRLGGERSEVTILCSDIRGFTKLAKEMEPGGVVEMLNDYFAELVPIIFAHQGTVDKYMGDAVLAIFGSPEPDPQHPEQAVRTGLAMQAAVAKLNAERGARGLPARDIGIGIHRGEVVHGFIGTEDRMEFTVIGDTVNRASRYCAGAQAGEVLISPELYKRVKDIVQAEPTTISTKHEGDFIAYRVTCLKVLTST